MDDLLTISWNVGLMCTSLGETYISCIWISSSLWKGNDHRPKRVWAHFVDPVHQLEISVGKSNSTVADNNVRATFVLGGENIQSLKRFVLTECKNENVEPQKHTSQNGCIWWRHARDCSETDVASMEGDDGHHLFWELLNTLLCSREKERGHGRVHIVVGWVGLGLKVAL